MTDSFTEVSYQSWGSRIGDSLKGILFGLFLFVAAFPLLFWNEGRAIQTEKSLEEGAAAVISVDPELIDPQNEKKLVYATGLASTHDELKDSLFNIKTQAIRLSRNVLIYQWHETEESETEKEMGGSTKTSTTYSYDKQWLSSLTSSSTFKYPEGHKNPSSQRYGHRTYYANNVTLGQFKLNSNQIREISGGTTMAMTEQNLPKNVVADIVDDEIYIGDADNLQIGDVRISFSVIKPQTISLIAAQRSNSFSPYQTTAGNKIQLLTMGTVSAKEMFENELANNRLLTWGLRLLGFILMMIGLSMIMKVLSVLADVIPFIGNILEMGTGFIAAIIALIFSLLTIAIAWVFYRPFMAFILIVAVLGLLFYLKNETTSQAIPSSVPPAT